MHESVFRISARCFVLAANVDLALMDKSWD